MTSSHDEARRALLDDEQRRPNALIAATHVEISRLRSQLVPLLDEAERRMQCIEAHHFVADGALLRRIAASSGRSIVQNAGSFDICLYRQRARCEAFDSCH